MSRSYRKNPIKGLGSDSEKYDKQKNSRKLRKLSKLALNRGDELMPLMNEISDVWSMAKDGKIHIDKDNKKEMSK